MLERLRNKKGYRYLGIIALVVILFSGLRYTDPVYKLKSNNKLQLQCLFQNGYRIVPKNKIIAYDDESGTWAFVNGWARNCEIVDTSKN